MTDPVQHPPSLLPDLRRLTVEAGRVVLSHYRRGTAVETKADDSPVTRADREAEAVILEGLAALTPGLPVIAEEEVAAGRVPSVTGGNFWLVDPLDGTKEFIHETDEFTVNIALMRDFHPVAGVIYAPALDTLYAAAGPGTAIRCEGAGMDMPITARAMPETGAVVVASRRHGAGETLERFLAPLKVADFANAGSSLKFCLVASGRADLYPRFGPTCEWDIAAGHAILEAAGGQLVTESGTPMRYGKPDFLNPGFVAGGRDFDPALAAAQPS